MHTSSNDNDRHAHDGARGTRRRAWKGGMVPPPAPDNQGPASLPPPLPSVVAHQWRKRRETEMGRSFRATPSWLASMVMHLVAMLLLASLVIPLKSSSRLQQLFVQFGTEALEPPNPLMIEAAARDSEVDATSSGDSSDVDQARADQTQQEAVSDQPRQGTPQGFEGFDWSIPEPTAELSAVSQDVLSENVVEFRPVANFGTIRDPQHDEIVERFIQFDIGSLRGAAGQQANRDFHNLGVESLPAMIRGLNRSASIHASCPVGVISRKVETMLSEADDPQLAAYAIENMGVGIPTRAPHRARIMALRRKLDRRFGLSRDRIRQFLAEEGITSPNAYLRYIERLAEGNHAPLCDSMASVDPREREAALLSVLFRGMDFNESQRTVLAQRIIDGMETEVKRWRLELAQRALCRLAGVPESINRHDVAGWREFWEHEQRVRRLVNSSVAALKHKLQRQDTSTRRAVMTALTRRRRQMGDTLRHELAMMCLQDLDASDGKLAKTARETLVHLSRDPEGDQWTREQWTEFWGEFRREQVLGPRSEAHLRQALNLERNGRTGNAAKRYRRLITTFPGTSAAREAQQRLKWIEAGNR